jgi:hypothetical protein
VVLLFAGALVTSMPQYKVSADPCRPKSTLGITSIIPSAVAHAELNPDGSGTTVFIVDFTVATQHAVLCGSTIPNCSNDMFIFRSDSLPMSLKQCLLMMAAAGLDGRLLLKTSFQM